jgi:hypothetical protein
LQKILLIIILVSIGIDVTAEKGRALTEVL